jgi:hypothetical protein
MNVYPHGRPVRSDQGGRHERRSKHRCGVNREGAERGRPPCGYSGGVVVRNRHAQLRLLPRSCRRGACRLDG